jgi:hypothetical protein
MLARVHAVADPSEVEDPEYTVGLREAVKAAIDYGIAGIESEGLEHTPIPDRLLTQARAAARNGVSLDTVLRRYSAGYALLDEHLIHVATEGMLSGEELTASLRSLSAVFHRLLAAISEEYAREGECRPRSAASRRADQVEKLLAGESVDPSELNYRLDIWHLAAIVLGPGAAGAMRDLAAALDRNLLLVNPEGEVAWAWLGGRSRLSPREVLRLAGRVLPPEVSLALGEPGEGVEGWRLAHRQAKAAIAIARRGPERLVRYADVALLASALRDDVLANSLREIYLAPLEEGRDEGTALRRTLEAYFNAGRNTSSAAAALGVSRKTVNVRLRSAGEKIGQPVDRCAAEMEIALKLRALARNGPGSLVTAQGSD